MGAVFIIFLVLLFLGVPVAFSIAVAGLWFFVQTPALPYDSPESSALQWSQKDTAKAGVPPS